MTKSFARYILLSFTIFTLLSQVSFARTPHSSSSLGIKASRTNQRALKDKSILYERYPQLLSEDTNACVRGLSNLIINMRSVDEAEIMVQESMHAINDLGSKRAC